MISYEDAQCRLIAMARTVLPVAEQVSISEARGRYLAQDVIAARSHPPFDSSAMDGFALQWRDIQNLPATLNIIGDSQAGRRFAGRLGAGQAVRIFTGAPLPDGADTVVVQEDAHLEQDQLIITGRPSAIGGHIRKLGQDIKQNALLLSAGARIDIRHAALMAAAGCAHVSVGMRPHVEIILCGDELKMPGAALGRDDIISTNGLLLENALRHAGAHVTGTDTLMPDDLVLLMARIVASTADIIVTVGGASVGARDYVHAALKAVGADIDFWKIALRPGRPFMSARLGDKIIVGLPGNPVSAFVCGLLFAQPLVRALAGAAHPLPAFETARWAAAVPAGGQRAEFLRVRLCDGVATPMPVQDSSLLSELALADALALRPIDALAAAAGEPVRLIRIADHVAT